MGRGTIGYNVLAVYRGGIVSGKETYDVIFQYSEQGAEKVASSLSKVQDAVDKLYESGELSEDGVKKLTNELKDVGDAAEASASKVSGASTQIKTASEGQADGMDKATQSVERQTASLPTLRYALYDVAQTSATVSVAIAGIGTAAITASAQYESSFTAVERTTGAMGSELGSLRDQFLQLTREIPQTFGEIADIGARGAQVGIANDQLAEFTETIAKFVATSDTVSLDQSVEAFGRLANLLGDTNFSQIGSAITGVGINAAATEGQIVKITQELAPFASSVGLSTAEVIGLSAAMGSLLPRPELARSAFQTLNNVLNRAIFSGSDNLQAFADLLGVSNEELAKMWKTDPAQFLQSFTRALGGVDDLTAAFDALGLKEKRATQVFTALANSSRDAGEGVSLLEQMMSEATVFYDENMEMNRQYALVIDDLVAKWQIFINAIGEFASATGNVLLPAVKIIVEELTKFVHFLTRITQSNFGQWVIGAGAVLGALAFAATSLITVMALTAASVAAMGTAIGALNVPAGASIFTISGLGAAFRSLAVSAGMSATSIAVFSTALKATGVGLAVVAVGALAAAFADAGETAEQTFNRFTNNASGLAEALAQDQADYAEALATGNTKAINSFTVLDETMRTTKDVTLDSNEVFENAAMILGEELTPAIIDTTDSLDTQISVLGENANAWLTNSLLQSEAFQQLAANADFVDSWVALGVDFQTVLNIAATDGYNGIIAYFEQAAQATANGGGAYLEGLGLLWNQIGQYFSALGDNIASAWDKLLSGDFGGAATGFSSFILDAATASMTDFYDILSTPVLRKEYDELAKVTSGMAEFAKETGRATAARQRLADVDDGDYSSPDSGGDGGGAAGANKEKDAVDKLRDAWDRKIEKMEEELEKFKKGNEAKLKLMERELEALERYQDVAQRAYDDGLQALENQKKALEDNVKAAQAYADSLITVADYAGTVATVFDRAFSIRFDFGNTEDAITTMFRNITNGFKDAARSVRDLRTEIKSINAGIQEDQAKLSKLEYWRGIASMYGDTARVEQLDAEIAKTRADLASKNEKLTDTTEDLAAAENATSRSLVGNSEQAIINRAAMKGLADGYKDLIVQAIASGKSEEEVAKLIRDSQKAFEDQATQLGFSKKEAKTYYDSIGDLSTILLAMPKEVKPTISITGLTPANAAITEFLRKFNAAEAVKKAQIRVETQQKKIEDFKEKSDEAVKLRTAKINVTDQRDKIKTFKSRADAAVKTRTADIRVERKKANEALNKLQANIRAKTQNGKAGTNGGRGGGYGVKINANPGMKFPIPFKSWDDYFRNEARLAQEAANRQSLTLLLQGDYVGSKKATKGVGRFIGGYAGQGGMYEPRGTYHAGEYIIPKRDVNQATGLPYADALGRLMNGQTAAVNYNTVNNRSTGGGQVDLSAQSIQLIAQAVDPRIFLDGNVLGQSVTKSFVNSSNVGSN